MNIFLTQIKQEKHRILLIGLFREAISNRRRGKPKPGEIVSDVGMALKQRIHLALSKEEGDAYQSLLITLEASRTSAENYVSEELGNKVE